MKTFYYFADSVFKKHISNMIIGKPLFIHQLEFDC